LRPRINKMAPPDLDPRSEHELRAAGYLDADEASIALSRSERSATRVLAAWASARVEGVVRVRSRGRSGWRFMVASSVIRRWAEGRLPSFQRSSSSLKRKPNETQNRKT